MQQRHKYIGLAVLGTVAPIALGALITGQAMADDGASDAVVASVSMILPDPDGEGFMECTLDGIDMTGEAVLIGDGGASEVGIPGLPTDADGEVFTVTATGDAQVVEGQFVEGQVIEGQLDVTQLEGEGTIIGETGVVPVEGEAFELVPFDFGDVRQGTAEECAAVDQPVVQVVEAP